MTDICMVSKQHRSAYVVECTTTKDTGLAQSARMDTMFMVQQITEVARLVHEDTAFVAASFTSGP